MVAYAGFFNDVGKAKAAKQALKDKQYSEEEVLLIEPTTGDDLKKAISYAKGREYITKDVARRAAAEIEKGKALLVVKARLGDGSMVEGLFADGAEKLSTWSESTQHTFFSDIIGIPLLSATRSGASGPPSAGRPFTERFAPCIIQRKGPRESSMGMPLSMKSLVTQSFLPLLAKPLVTSGLLPLTSTKKKTTEK